MYVSGKNFWAISSLFSEIKKVKVLKKLYALYWDICLYGNICYVIYINAFFSLGPINVCTNFEINRFKIEEFRKHANIVCLFNVTWRKNGTSYVMAGI